jgi:hypothetical protein
MKGHVIKMSDAEYPLLNRQDILTLQNKWIPAGRDNLYFNFLTDLMYKSSIHNSIQNGKHELAFGGGLTWNENGLDQNSINIINKLFNSPNNSEDLNEIFEKILLDRILYGADCFQIIWSKDRQTIAEMYHVSYETVRKGKPNEDGIIDEYFLSNDWQNYKRKINKPVRIAAFDVNNRKEAVQLIYSQKYFPTEIYAVPTYSASIPYILTDHEISKHHLNSIKNGLSANFILNVASGIPSEEEMEYFVDDVKRNLVSGNGQKIVITFSEGRDGETTFMPIEIQDEHQKFITLNEAVLQNLLTANRLTSPELLGVKVPGELGGGDFNESFELYYNQVISKIQAEVLKDFNRILKINGAANAEFSVIKPNLTSNKLSEAITGRVLTINELRKQLGQEELSGVGDILLP